MKNKIMSFILAVLIVAAALPLGMFTAIAYTEGYYTYKFENGEATITKVDSSISGDITIPSTLGGCPVTIIYPQLFYNCDGITSVTIPDSVTSIRRSAFYNCTKLTNITIPDSVFEIGMDAFGNTAWYNNQPDGLVYADKVAYKYKGTMPDDTSIVLKEGTKVIADRAFSNCTGLTSITIPDSVTSIGSWAFYECKSLVNVTIPDSVSLIGSNAFENCFALTSATIPDSVKYLASTFEGCRSLTSVRIGNSVETINNWTFGNCSKLTTITIPDSVTSIGYYAFEGCTELKTVKLSNSLKVINTGMFKDCTSLTTVDIPDSVTSIETWAFQNCTSLTSVNFGKSVSIIGAYCFDNCSSLTSVTLPNSVKRIDREAFLNCTELTEVNLGNSVSFIGYAAFYNCEKLMSIIMPSSVGTIARAAFSSSYRLTDVYYTGSRQQRSSIELYPENDCLEDAVWRYNYVPCTHTNTEIRNKISATCTMSGYSGDTYCKDCGEKISTGAAVPALGHDLTWHSAEAATCTEVGWNAFENCSRCDYTTYQEFPSLGHDYVTTSTSQTCTSGGVVTSVCSRCGDVKTETVLPKGHTVVTDPAIAATCTDEGKTQGSHCSVCNTVITAQTIIPPLNHDYKAVVTAPTCQSVGYTTYTCRRCGDTKKGDYTPETEHNWISGATIKEATCTATGEKKYICSSCGTSKIEVIPITAHSAVTDPAIAATCTTEGKTQGSHCSVCNAVITAQTTVPPLNHDYNAVVTAPTCTESGYTTYTCKRCGDTKKGDYTPEVGHKWIEGATIVEPTCTTTGEKKYICSSCGATKKGTIPVTAHSVVTDPAIVATCTTEGKTQGSHCSVCNTVITAQTIIPPLNHNYKAVETAMSCTEAGYITYTCTRCGDTYTTSESTVLGHDWDEGTVTKAPTCTADGIKTYTCRRDNSHTKTETIPATGHTAATAVQENRVAATCTAQGHFDSVVYCSVCRAELSRDVVYTNALGHNYSEEWSKDATNHWHKCSVCGDKKDVAAHTLVNGKCTVCGYGNRINFPDVDYTAWYGEAVEYAVGAGLMKGYANGKFGTADGIQRQDFIVILARLSGANLDNYANKTNFKDAAKGAYYYTALAWAKAEGVSKGYDNGKFGVGDKVTREQIVTFLYNYAKLMGYDTTATLTETEVKKTYSDYGKVSSFAKEATLWALSKGVISGKETRTGKQIAPQANAQRCEVAKMFFNISQNNIFE